MNFYQFYLLLSFTIIAILLILFHKQLSFNFKISLPKIKLFTFIIPKCNITIHHIFKTIQFCITFLVAWTVLNTIVKTINFPATNSTSIALNTLSTSLRFPMFGIILVGAIIGFIVIINPKILKL
jgi:hypothetical protein